MKKKVLLFGDNEGAPYHPLKNVEGEVKKNLDMYADIIVSDNRDCLRQDLSQYKVLISYMDRWNGDVRDEINDIETANLINYVANGGSLLLLHTGISLAAREEIQSMIGAKFIQHPQAEALPFTVEGDHSICEGVNNFKVHEEPYEYTFSDHVQKDVFLTYEYRGRRFEAGWTTKFGLGHMLVLHPGHERAVLQVPDVAKLLVNSLKWCLL